MPPRPSSVQLERVEVDSAEFSWPAVRSADTYFLSVESASEVLANFTLNADDANSLFFTTTSFNFTEESLRAGTNYSLSITAFNEAGSSDKTSFNFQTSKALISRLK